LTSTTTPTTYISTIFTANYNFTVVIISYIAPPPPTTTTTTTTTTIPCDIMPHKFSITRFSFTVKPQF